MLDILGYALGGTGSLCLILGMFVWFVGDRRGLRVYGIGLALSLLALAIILR